MGPDDDVSGGLAGTVAPPKPRALPAQAPSSRPVMATNAAKNTRRISLCDRRDRSARHHHQVHADSADHAEPDDDADSEDESGALFSLFNTAPVATPVPPSADEDPYEKVDMVDSEDEGDSTPSSRAEDVSSMPKAGKAKKGSWLPSFSFKKQPRKPNDAAIYADAPVLIVATASRDVDESSTTLALKQGEHVEVIRMDYCPAGQYPWLPYP